MKFKDFARIHISLFARISACTFVICILLKIIAALSSAFADFFNRYIASLPRAALAYVTSVIPFSLAEAVIIMILPIALLYLLYCAFVAAKKGSLTRHIFNLMGLICLLLSMFTVNFSIAYNCTPIEDKMELDTESVTSKDIHDACIMMLDELDTLEGSLMRDAKGSVIMPYSFSEMSKMLNDAYKSLYRKYTFISPLYASPKRIALSKPMTYTGLSGIYTFFTGEANVNTNFPDYAVTFTSAHEMAHQRGIAPEDEANFVAFLACYNSDDPYLRYCALIEGANYLSNSLYYSDKELFESIRAQFSNEAITEYTVYLENLSPYTGKAAGEVSESINDFYLKSQGQSEGIHSYDLVTELATAYMLSK